MVILLLLFSPLIVHADSVSTSATAKNTAPTIDNLDLSPDDDLAIPGVQVINLYSGTNKTVTTVANVSDDNGWDDVVNVTAEITGPSVVEDSPVNLSFDRGINVTTAVYMGSFNMSNQSEGEYKVEVTATDAGGLNGTSSTNFTYSYEILKYTIWANSTKDIKCKCKGIADMTLEYTGSGTVDIRAYDKRGTMITEVLNASNGDAIFVDGTTLKKGKLGTETTVKIYDNATLTLIDTQKIHTSCSRPLDVGMTFGDLVVTALNKIIECPDDDTIHWSGSKNVVRGNIHSNMGIKVKGSSNMVIGTTEYVSKFTDSGKNNTFIPPPIKVTPEPFPIQYNISDYAPGGPEAIAAEAVGKYHYITKKFHASGSDVVLDGLYYVKGDAKLSGKNISGVFTIVAEKKIEVKGSKHNCSAYSTNLLLMSGKDKGDIKIASSKSTFCGVIYTKEGKIEMSGSKNTLNGGLFGDTVKLSGSELNINARQATGCSIIKSDVQTSEGNVILNAIKAILGFFR